MKMENESHESCWLFANDCRFGLQVWHNQDGIPMNGGNASLFRYNGNLGFKKM